MKGDTQSPPGGEPEAVPVVIATMGSSEEVIESVAIVDSQHARAWLISVPRDFRPPEPDWYYVYITSRPTRFWNGDNLLLDAKEPAVTVFPPGIEHVARLDQPAFVFGASTPDAGEIDPSAWPRTASVPRIEKPLMKLGGRPLRLIVGRKLRDEEDWEDRDWSMDEKGGVPTRQVLVNKRDLFELSVADQSTNKAAHLHRRTFEAYASLTDVQLFWRDTKENFQLVKGPAVVVFSPLFCHAVSCSGTTFVLRVSGDGWAIADDGAPCKISG